MENFENLPTDILLDIITRLPTESILDCKLVRKLWRHLISHISFSQLHLTRLHHSADSGKLSFLVKVKNRRQLCYFEYTEKHDETPIHSFRTINATPPFPSAYAVLGSFNGLVCLFGLPDYGYCICNPLTKEYVVLPKVKRDFGDQHYETLSMGFGYLSLTNEYKVVHLYKSRKEPSFIEAAVYTLGIGNGWRILERSELMEPTFDISLPDPGVYVNEALHWADNTGGRVLVFDLAKEKFRKPFSSPPLPQGGMFQNFANKYTIGEISGVLYYGIKYYRLGEIGCDIWLLKKKNDNLDMKQQQGGDDEPMCWSKEFQVPLSEPLAITDSGGILCFNYSSLSIYDSLASTLKVLVGFRGFRQIFRHQLTLVPLKEYGEDVKIMESAEIEEARIRNLQQSS